jgi:Periplasmic copper-binding protein (NosD)
MYANNILHDRKQVYNLTEKTHKRSATSNIVHGGGEMSTGYISRVVTVKRWSAALMVASLATSIAAQAATLTVGTCPGAGFSTIQTAVDAAHAGDTVNVCPGSYPEQVSINKSLTLQGIAVGNQNAAVIAAPAGGLVANATDPRTSFGEAAQVLVTTGTKHSTSVKLQNLTVDGLNNGIVGCTPTFPMVLGILYQDAGGTVSNVATQNQMLPPASSGCDSGSGIRVESSPSAGKQSVTAQNSTVHDYQKNGITAIGDSISVALSKNSIRGQGPTTGGPENGIQVSFGATGKVQNNDVIDNVFIGNNGFAGSGILVFGSSKVQVTGNTVGNNQFGIAVESVTPPDADNTLIKSNMIFGTLDIDGIDLCSNNNTVTNNTIASSDESGIDLDSGCGSTGNNNSVKRNTINQACAGILAGSGTSGNTTTPNTFFNVTNTILAADVCPAAALAARQGQAQSASGHLRAAPAL